MTFGRWLAGAGFAAVAGIGAWQAATWIGDGRGVASPVAAPRSAAAAPGPAATPSPAPQVSEVERDVAPLLKGETPMPQRVAIVGFLNKRNGETRDLMLKPGEATRIGDAIVRLRACEKTAPWEQDQFTGAFLQLDVEGADRRWRRVFSGWVFKERPALNVVQHRVYDVWPKSCRMSFPATGPDTVAPSAGAAPARRSSASNAPSTEGAPVASPAADGPSAAPSNAL